MTKSDVSFEHDSTFEQGEVAGNIRLGEFEARYQELFAEVIEDGVITVEERVRLDRAATELGLDKARLAKLETALKTAYESRHHAVIHDLSGTASHARKASSLDARGSSAPGASEHDLRGHIKALENRIEQLERELTEARAQVDIQVDFSIHESESLAASEDEAAHAMRRIRDNPRDVESMKALYAIYTAAGDEDKRWCVAHALSFLQAANDDEERTYLAGRPEGLIRPTTSLSQEGWRRLLVHPDEEVIIGEIFALIVSAVLLGRLSALRRDKLLPSLDPSRKQNPATSTVQAVRCFAWASSILGMAMPALYTDPDFEGGAQMAPAIPPAVRLGHKVLSGRLPVELAFVAGRHLAWYREERFVRLLTPSIDDLESLFLAALFIANPSIPMGPAMKGRVEPLAAAIEPLLDPARIDRLRACLLRFIEEGGRTNLQRWVTAAELTAVRAGFLLCNDLFAADTILKVDHVADPHAAIDGLLVFVTSNQYAQLRSQLGIAIRR